MCDTGVLMLSMLWIPRKSPTVGWGIKKNKCVDIFNPVINQCYAAAEHKKHRERLGWAPIVSGSADLCSPLALITTSWLLNLHQASPLSCRPILFFFISPCKRLEWWQFHFFSVGQRVSSVLGTLLTDECVCVPSPDEVTMEEVGQAAQLRAGELIIIVVVLIMWAGNVPSSAMHIHHCRPYGNP